MTSPSRLRKVSAAQRARQGRLVGEQHRLHARRQRLAHRLGSEEAVQRRVIFAVAALGASIARAAPLCLSSTTSRAKARSASACGCLS